MYSLDDHTEAKFLVLTVGYRIINYGPGLSYRPTRLHRLAWRAGTTTLCHIVDYNLQSGSKNLASENYCHQKILHIMVSYEFFGFRPAFWRCVALQN